MGKQLNVVAYIRCSTVEQADEGFSIDAQRAKVEAYAVVCDLNIIAIDIDAGISAKSYGSLARTLHQRPGLAKAVSRLDAGEAAGLLVLKLDRLSRSVRDLDELVQRYFASRFALVSASDQIDTRTASGRMTLNIIASVAQGERETIGERTAAALSVKRSRGEYTGGQPTYGWRVGDDGVHIEPHNGEQHAISIARMLRAQGASLRKIGHGLEANGTFPRSGKHWHASTIRKLLMAPIVRETSAIALAVRGHSAMGDPSP